MERKLKKTQETNRELETKLQVWIFILKVK